MGVQTKQVGNTSFCVYKSLGQTGGKIRRV